MISRLWEWFVYGTPLKAPPDERMLIAVIHHDFKLRKNRTLTRSEKRKALLDAAAYLKSVADAFVGKDPAP